MKKPISFVLLLIAIAAAVVLVWSGKVLNWFSYEVINATVFTESTEAKTDLKLDFCLFFGGVVALALISALSLLSLGKKPIGAGVRVVLIARGVLLLVGARFFVAGFGSIVAAFATLGYTGTNPATMFQSILESEPKTLIGLSVLAVGFVLASLAPLLSKSDPRPISSGRATAAWVLRILECVGYLVVLGLFGFAGVSILELDAIVSQSRAASSLGSDPSDIVGLITNVLLASSAAGVVLHVVGLLAIVSGSIHPSRPPLARQ